MSALAEAAPTLGLDPFLGEPKSITLGVRKRSFVFLSCCPERWGGSEELWSGVALRFALAGHQVFAAKTGIDPHHPQVVSLREAGTDVEDYNLRFHASRIASIVRRLTPRRWLPPEPDRALEWLCRSLYQRKPDLAVISQGDNLDGAKFADACYRCGVPYAIICQKASEQKWPSDEGREAMRQTFFRAERVYFVSEHNRGVTEAQIGGRLNNAEVVRNPFLTKGSVALPWPSNDSGRFKIACVARLFAMEKGQDILLSVLARNKWRERSIDVSFFGKGMNEHGLRGMATLLNLANVNFAGFSWDPTEIWRTHHALALPSRCEGLPLALVEAMMCGRPAIVTDVGGSAEVLGDNETGFLAAAPTVQAFDEAMERAWRRRDEWRQIGARAASSIRSYVPPDACAVLADKLIAVTTSLVGVP
jgi:glycosyltransferase involved in cell wall biosynthesis